MKHFIFVFTILVNQISFGMNEKNSERKLEVITLGAGCFWCVEAVFQRVKGVVKVESGYSGGKIAHPTYREVTSGLTGHAEVIQLSFDPEVISLSSILEIFWKTHDPTTLNRQGADVGTQYRSAIFYHTETQKKVASTLKEELNKSEIWGKPIVTEITPFQSFYKAEDYHQDYFNQNANQPYCQFVIVPKLEKFEKIFKDYSVSDRK
ncbi:MAG: peptide-methionine (S)-S-oxide reductase MsrA [Bacteroidales bacterium]|nr:peptide-methionine (S)-S-oxide reductase MsrA [Bacteroidales bacterium]